MKGLEVSLRCFAQYELVQSQIRHRPSKPLVFLLKLFQTGELRTLHSTIQFPPTLKCLLRNTDLAHRLGNRRALSLQNFNLPKLRYNLFGLFSLSSHR